MQGLKLHLEACHDRFVYGFWDDHPDVAPAIHVACADEQQMVQQETGRLHSAIVQASSLRWAWQLAPFPVSSIEHDHASAPASSEPCRLKCDMWQYPRTGKSDIHIDQRLRAGHVSLGAVEPAETAGGNVPREDWQSAWNEGPPSFGTPERTR